MRRVINGTSEDDELDGTKHSDIIHGKGGNDKIGGHKGDDFIFGDAGNDRLHGGEDHDELTGGGGSDTFIFRSFELADRDKVMDFKHGTDIFELDALVFPAIDQGQLRPGQFNVGKHADDGNDHIIYNRDTGKLFYDDDGKGGHAQHLLAILDNHAKVSADDIFIL
jgi:Ca2+-binding RTX toxin-like protein